MTLTLKKKKKRQVTKESEKVFELRMSPIWTSVRPLTWSPTTSFSLNWREMDLMGGLFGGCGIGWMVASRG